MKKALKKIFEQFIFCVTVLTVIAIIFAGKVTAEQKGEQMTQNAKYAMVSLVNRDDRIEFKTDNETYYLDKAFIQKIKDMFDLPEHIRNIFFQS
ncbi:MAG: hypothetical protein ACI4GY_00220 [Acutalibacteraceae bacterium]